jgi:hypothetical protein
MKKKVAKYPIPIREWSEDDRPIPEVLEELRELEREAKKIDADLEKVFAQMGFK